MGEVGLNFLLQQLGYQVPTLVVCLVAFVLALVFVRRAMWPALLTMAGVAVLVFAALGLAVIQAFLWDARADGLDQDKFAWRMRALAITGSVARALGLALLVAAVFVGRKPRMKEWSAPANRSARSFNPASSQDS